MNTDFLLYLCGIYSLCLAIFHILFWKLFDWKHELEKSNVANRVMIQIFNCRLIYFFLFVAFLCFRFPGDLVSSELGRAFMIGMSLFWLGRTIEQFVFLPYNTIMVHTLTVVFIVGAVIFAAPVLLTL